jgi:hypothetical protein
MSQKNKKQFGVWMDTHHAIVVGHADAATRSFSILGHLSNADEVHVTGTGTAQEQFIHFLADTPPFKNTATTEDTSNKMSNEGLVEFIGSRFH